MKKVTVYREAPLNSYYRSLIYLEADGEIEIEFFNHKGLETFAVKLWYCFPIVRKLTGKTPRQKEPCWSELLKSLVYPLRLLSRRTIVVAFAPYSTMVVHFVLLKMLGKEMIYFSSWPYWGEGKYVHRPIPGTRKMWESFLKNLPAVGVTKKSANGLSMVGANARNIPHSVDTGLFVPAKSRNSENLKILYVGRVVKEKGITELARVFDSLLRKYPNLELSIVGDGPELRKIKDRKGVSCKGYMADETNLIKEYQSSDIFVLNSFAIHGWQEFFGMALIEAMACGLPCITTDCVGPRELVADGVNGFIIPQKDEKALDAKLERLIVDKNLRVEFGKRGREKATEYSVASNAQRWLAEIFDRTARE